MLILTKHAKSRLAKRLLKKRNWNIQELYKNLKKFLVNADIKYIPYRKYLLVKICNAKCCMVGKCLYDSNVKDISNVDYIYLLDENLNLYVKVKANISKFKYKYYDSMEKVLYLGDRRPILIFTFRPKKKND